MAYLIDTNVFSELRKGPRTNGGVARWFSNTEDAEVHTSVLVIGELRRGANRIRRRDTRAAAMLDRWLQRMTDLYAERILPVTLPISLLWGGYGVPDPVPDTDGLLAATAEHHGLTLVTRNTRDVTATGVDTLNPFS